MFGIFKKKSAADKLQQSYEQLMKKAFEMSKINRSESDALYARADEIMKQIEAIQPK